MEVNKFDEKYEVESLSDIKAVYSLDMLVNDGIIDSKTLNMIINDKIKPDFLFILSGTNYNRIDKKKYPIYDDWLNELYKKISSLLPFDITVFRGISVNIISSYKIGDVMIHEKYLWTSLDFEYADNFRDDTSECYTKELNFTHIKKLENRGTMFKIKIPKGTSYYDNSSYNHFYWYNGDNIITSELLFGCNHKFKVVDIDHINNIIEIILVS